jgi:RHS repeat-associated protein
MTSKSEGSNRWRYLWDYENRMTSASNKKQTVRYRYDALGRRIQRYFVGGKENTKFIYDGLDVVADDNSGVSTKYQNGLGIDNKLKMITNGTAKYFLADHLGSTTALTDSSGNVSSSANYDSFGNTTRNLSTRYQFTGREFDNFTGFTFYRTRWYDGRIGRFVSEDPIGLNGGDINVFGYVKSNPINFKDPLGLVSNPFYAGCVATYTTLGAGVGFVAGGGLGLITGPGAVAASPLAALAGTSVGGALGAGIGSLACGTPAFPNQADALPRLGTPPFVKPGNTCDAKPRVMPRAPSTPFPTPLPDRDGCAKEWSRAYEICAKAMVEGNRGITGGHRDEYSCAKGLVSKRCGGNAY